MKERKVAPKHRKHNNMGNLAQSISHTVQCKRAELTVVGRTLLLLQAPEMFALVLGTCD